MSPPATNRRRGVRSLVASAAWVVGIALIVITAGLMYRNSTRRRSGGGVGQPGGGGPPGSGELSVNPCPLSGRLPPEDALSARSEVVCGSASHAAEPDDDDVVSHLRYLLIRAISGSTTGSACTTAV